MSPRKPFGSPDSLALQFASDRLDADEATEFFRGTSHGGMPWARGGFLGVDAFFGGDGDDDCDYFPAEDASIDSCDPFTR